MGVIQNDLEPHMNLFKQHVVDAVGCFGICSWRVLFFVFGNV